MDRKFVSSAALALLLVSTLTAPAFARGNDYIIKNGSGEELVIKNGLFGKKTRVIKDRLGNKIEQKQGIFGGKETNVNLLGNNYSKKKGWFGGSKIEGSTILGDKVTTKTGFFGRRETTIDVSGLTNAVKGLIGNKLSPGKSNTPALPTAPADPTSFLPGSNMTGMQDSAATF